MTHNLRILFRFEDAEISLAFHQGRQKYPERFSSRIFNKSYYLKTFLSQIPLKAKYINNVITLKAENEQINLPNIQVINIYYYKSIDIFIFRD